MDIRRWHSPKFVNFETARTANREILHGDLKVLVLADVEADGKRIFFGIILTVFHEILMNN
jgi:hypothetical protein